MVYAHTHTHTHTTHNTHTSKQLEQMKAPFLNVGATHLSSATNKKVLDPSMMVDSVLIATVLTFGDESFNMRVNILEDSPWLLDEGRNKVQ